MSATSRREVRHQSGAAGVRRALGVAAAAALAAAMAAPSLDAANVTRTATMTATINAVVKLTLSRATIPFPPEDPDAVPAIPASGGPVVITARGRTAVGSVITLSVSANQDLQSGLDVIPISRIRWAAAGPGFMDGVLNAALAQPVAAWTGSGSWVGSQTFVFANSWDYVPGTYSATLTYTLSAP